MNRNRLFTVIGIVGLLAALGCSNQPTRPAPLTFEQQIAATQAYADFTARRIAIDLSTLESHDLTALGSSGTLATAKVPGYGVVGFAYSGDRTNVGTVQGYGIRVERQGLLARVSIESPDSNHVSTLGYNSANQLIEAKTFHAFKAGVEALDWDRFFACVQTRADDLPTWADVTCGASLFLCTFGNPAGCLASAVCAAVYLGPCIIDELPTDSAILESTAIPWGRIKIVYR